MNFKEECLRHMNGNGFPFNGSLITDGEIHRFSIDQKKNQPDEWYVGFEGIGPRGNTYLQCIYGSWSTGDRYTYKSWKDDLNSYIQQEEISIIQQQMILRQQEIDAIGKEKHAKGSELAKILWEAATEDENHPYLIEKKVKGFNIRRGRVYGYDSLIVPLKNIEGELRSLQYIYKDPDGTLQKRFLPGGEKKGNFHLIGQLDQEFAVCEGYATGASWHEATGMPTIVAFDAGNLNAVVKVLRHTYPYSSILIVADDDVGKETNTGRQKALETAAMHNCRVIFPNFDAVHDSQKNGALSDFNDLHALLGIDEVRKQHRQFQESISPIQRGGITKEELERTIQHTNDFDELTGPLLQQVASSPFGPIIKDKLIGLIATKTKISIAALKKEAKLYSTSIHQNHVTIARQVIETFGTKNLISDSMGRIWKWTKTGVWIVADDKEIKQTILRTAIAIKITKSSVESIFDILKTEIFDPFQRFNVTRDTINCPNGELEWRDGTWHMRPHCKGDYRTTQIPHYYDPNAIAPRFEQFLDEIFEGDEDKEDKKAVVYELLGYSLLSTSEFEKFVLLIGDGSNGKSVLLHIVECLLGSSNTTAVQPAQFDNRFQRAHLEGKLANIITEIAEGSEIPDAQLKAIVSGEKTTAEHKHRPPFDFHPFCTCWFGTNHQPHTRDFSNALFRRAIILTFNQKFDVDRQDIHLTKKLEKELPGILNLALKGLNRLFIQKAFTVCISSEKANEKWRLDCDQVALFVDECCSLSQGATIASQDLYNTYTQWTQELGLKRNVNRNTLTSRLRRFHVTPDRGAHGKRLLLGIQLKITN